MLFAKCRVLSYSSHRPLLLPTPSWWQTRTKCKAASKVSSIYVYHVICFLYSLCNILEFRRILAMCILYCAANRLWDWVKMANIIILIGRWSYDVEESARLEASLVGFSEVSRSCVIMRHAMCAIKIEKVGTNAPICTQSFLCAFLHSHINILTSPRVWI